MIDTVVSEVQYANHLLPIWRALDPSERGAFWVSGTATDAAAEAGIPYQVGRPRGAGPLTLVASFSDVRRAVGREFILVEHGSGQTYQNCSHPSYSGGEGREKVTLFLCPNQQVADRNLARYPNAQAAVVGSPVLDALLSARDGGRAERQAPRGDFRDLEESDSGSHGPTVASKLDSTVAVSLVDGGGDSARQSLRKGCPTPSLGDAWTSERPATVAISFHWDARLRDKDGQRVPEASWAFPHYQGALKSLRLALKDSGVHLIGHGHPRVWRPLRQAYHEAGIEAVKEFSEVIRRASVYCIDNSSTGMEAMACGLSVVWLNSPKYRCDVTHSGRFWNWTEGLATVDEPDQLYDQIMLALTDDPEHRKRRAELASEVYTYLDGTASERAVAAIRNL